MTVKELDTMLNEIEINYYESGAYYDTEIETFFERKYAEIEETYNLTIVEC